MSVFFNYSNPVCILGQAPSSFSNDPSIASLKELLIYELKQIAYYVLKLKELSIETYEVKNKMIYFISLVMANLDFKRNEFNQIIEGLRFKKNEIEKLYIEHCNEQGIASQLLKPSCKLDPENSDIINSITEGERQAILKNKILSKTKKNLYEIILNIVETICLYLTELDNYDIDDREAKLEVMKLLNITNFPSLEDDVWIESINKFSETSYRVMKQLNDVMNESYGAVKDDILVNTNIKTGPSILVSGHYFKDLVSLLEATKDEEVNIYTHDDMLVAHSNSEITDYPHLVGHFQPSQTNTQFNFASFRGPILISKNSIPNTEFIRGRIYTTDPYPAYGMSKIENNDFSRIIQAAKESIGFKKEAENVPIKVGFNRTQFLDKLREIFDKIKENKIKHLFLIDILNQYPYTNEYLDEFFNILPDDYYAISLSYPGEKENILHLDSYYGYSVIYLLLEELEKNFELQNLDITAIFTQCNTHTISHLLNLKQLGITSLYLGNCCPLTINPTLINGLDELFNIKYMSTHPAQDFETILNKYSSNN